MLILDGHASHISTRTIQFYVDNKIILLCLPPHTTHLLQPLDVDVFAPLATAYHTRLNDLTNLGAGYAIDKVDFLELLREARAAAITPYNITRAWEKTGLSPFDPQVVLQHFPAPKDSPQSDEYHIKILESNRPSTPPKVIISYNGPKDPKSIILTPHNSLEVKDLIQKVLHQGNAVEVAKKIGSVATSLFAENTCLERSNGDLFTIAQKRDAKKKRKKGAITSPAVLDREVLDKRREAWDWDTVWRLLSSIYQHIFGKQKPKLTREERIERRNKAATPKKSMLTTPKKPYTCYTKKANTYYTESRPTGLNSSNAS